jgi:hypothetical protein
VFVVYLLMAHPDGEFLHALESFASLFGETVDVHLGLPLFRLERESNRRAPGLAELQWRQCRPQSLRMWLR